MTDNDGFQKLVQGIAVLGAVAMIGLMIWVMVLGVIWLQGQVLG